MTEGEKAADALTAAGIPAVGTVTGAPATPSPATLAALTGRAVLLWPDNDTIGREHMDRIGAVLDTIAAPAWSTWPDAPPKGDAADFMAARTADDVAALLAAAHAWDAGGIPEPEPATAELPEYERLPPEDMAPAPERLLSPLVCDSRTMWYRAQGAGKGVLLMFAIAGLADGDGAFVPGSSVAGPVRVGVLDWEDNRDEIGERLHRVGVPAQWRARTSRPAAPSRPRRCSPRCAGGPTARASSSWPSIASCRPPAGPTA